MVLPKGKCKLIVYRNPGEQPFSVHLNGQHLVECKEVKLSRINIKYSLAFPNNINTLCRKASAKILALQKMDYFTPQNKRNVIADSFVASQRSYCPLIWCVFSMSPLAKFKRTYITSSALASANNLIFPNQMIIPRVSTKGDYEVKRKRFNNFSGVQYIHYQVFRLNNMNTI